MRTEQRDQRDAARLAHDYLQLGRCPGGRLIVRGYICPHCGTDPSYGDCKGVKPYVKGNEPPEPQR